MLKCHVCGKGPADGTTVYRQNVKGEIGIWACEAHNLFKPSPEVKTIVDAMRHREAP